jgi:hypothetical protein
MARQLFKFIAVQTAVSPLSRPTRSIILYGIQCSSTLLEQRDRGYSIPPIERLSQRQLLTFWDSLFCTSPASNEASSSRDRRSRSRGARLLRRRGRIFSQG